MTSNNSGWIMGAPKEAIACEWQHYADSRPSLLDREWCVINLRNKIVCCRHRPLNHIADAGKLVGKEEK